MEAKRGVLPRFGSKYRYSGRTLYETRVNTEQRTQPYFERTASKQYINNNRTRSMDDSELTALKRTHDEDPSWAESIENVPMFPCAGFVQWFCQTFWDRSTFLLWIWAPHWPWGMAMLVHSLLMKIRKGLACDMVVQCLTSGHSHVSSFFTDEDQKKVDLWHGWHLCNAWPQGEPC